jgi:hypothetical protein
MEEEGAVEIFIYVFMHYKNLKFTFVIITKSNIEQTNTQLNWIF